MLDFLPNLLANHSTLSPIIFIFFRALSVVIPPIPGFVLDLAGIFFFGSFLGFLYGETGVMLGAIAAFGIARKLKKYFLYRFLFMEKMKHWKKKIPKSKTFWALVAMRLPTNTIFDFLNYAVGLTEISSSKFFFSTLLGSLPSMILFYFFGGWAFQQGIYYFFAFIAAVIILWLVFRKRTYKSKSPAETVG